MEILSPSSGSQWPEGQFYIWGYQPHFAMEIRIAAERLFEQLDERLMPDAFLVAVRTDGKTETPAVVIEPNDHELQPEQFESLIELVKHSFKIAPGTQYMYPVDDPRGEAWAKRRERGEYRARVGKVIRQIILDQYDDYKPLVYVSAARQFEPYAVFCILTLSSHIHDQLPRLNKKRRDQFRVITSLVDAAASTFVDACWDAMPQSGVGDGFVGLPANDVLLSKAGYLFMHTPSYPCDEMGGLHNGFQAYNAIATLTYERSDSKGQLILSRKHHPNVEESLIFSSPCNVSDFRAVRKLLQLPKSDEALLCDSEHIYGIGRIGDGYDPNDEDLFCVEFVGHAKWQLVHSGVPLMRVDYGIPSLPSERIRAERFSQTFRRLFPESPPENVKTIRGIASAAARLTHGTIIVISADAKQEAERFGVQATRISPVKADGELLEMGSRIDGAILLSPDGVCHAIGVILDGDANPKGTAERGARFNSAIRYVYSRNSACLALVVSDDGMMDSVPPYRPTMSRREIAEHLADLRDIVHTDLVSQRAMNKETEWLADHRFYLSDEQCAEINQLYSEAEPKRDNVGALVTHGEFKRHPDMNDSYLTD